MGYFDYVNVKEIKCRKCGAELSDWQSKDADCRLETVELREVDNFYTDCRKCGTWNEYNRDRSSMPNDLKDFNLDMPDPDEGQ